MFNRNKAVRIITAAMAAILCQTFALGQSITRTTTAGAANTSATVLLPGNVPMEMVLIPGGTFTMGSPDTEADRNAKEGPQHTVTLGGFWLAKYELTQRQWQAIMGTKPWVGHSGVLDEPDSPAVWVSWNDAQAFLTALNVYIGRRFRPPSEAEWEYACRGGETTRFYWGDDSGYTAIGDYAWYTGNTGVPGAYPHVSGTKTANAFGLYDMSGNVKEWCQDWAHADYTGAPTDGSAWESPETQNRVTRGGAFVETGDACRSACRDFRGPTYAHSFIGFRIAAQELANDTTPPTGSIVINNNRSATNSRTVTIAMTWSDGTLGSGVGRMRFSDDGSTWSAYESLAPSRSYTLPAGAEGHRTIRVQFIDKKNNRSATYSDYILLDRVVPTGSIIINGGASTTTSELVTLGLAWSDAGAQVSRMRLSDDGAHWTGWMPPTTTRVHTLSLATGYHTVRVQYLDGAGNYSAVFSDYIKLLDDPNRRVVMLPYDVPLLMQWIPGGTCQMGCYPGESGAFTTSENPQHLVTVAGFWMSKYELTKMQWKALTKTEPWVGQANMIEDNDSPAVYVSWNDAQSCLAALNAYTGMGFRLPSEAEWEYACRAGSATRFYWGDDPGATVINDYAWWMGNTSSAGESYAHLAGLKSPNAYGLYDMSGNADEWCEDDWHVTYEGAPVAGETWVDSPRGTERVIRGGTIGQSANWCRSAYRTRGGPDSKAVNIGVRLVSTP